MLAVPSIRMFNWVRLDHKFSAATLGPILYRSSVRSASTITPKIFLESHLLNKLSPCRQPFSVDISFDRSRLLKTCFS